MAEKTIFDYLNNIYNKGNLGYDKKVAPAYLISMWLSHDKGLECAASDCAASHSHVRREACRDDSRSGADPPALHDA